MEARPGSILRTLAGAEEDSNRIAVIRRTQMDATLLNPLHVHRPGIHERLVTSVGHGSCAISAQGPALWCKVHEVGAWCQPAPEIAD